MRYLWNTLIKGLATVLPVLLTLYVVYWFGLILEQVLRPMIMMVLPDRYYHPGMGLVVGLLLLLLIGAAVNAWLVQYLIRMGDGLMARIPLVKSIYGALRDFMDYVTASRQHKEMKQVVLVSIADVWLIGFLTRESIDDMPMLHLSGDMVAVYLPMSYQIGGYTIYVLRSQVQIVDMSIEDAMRWVLTAGLSKAGLERPGQ